MADDIVGLQSKHLSKVETKRYRGKEKRQTKIPKRLYGGLRRGVKAANVSISDKRITQKFWNLRKREDLDFKFRDEEVGKRARERAKADLEWILKKPANSDSFNFHPVFGCRKSCDMSNNLCSPQKSCFLRRADFDEEEQQPMNSLSVWSKGTKPNETVEKISASAPSESCPSEPPFDEIANRTVSTLPSIKLTSSGETYTEDNTLRIRAAVLAVNPELSSPDEAKNLVTSSFGGFEQAFSAFGSGFGELRRNNSDLASLFNEFASSAAFSPFSPTSGGSNGTIFDLISPSEQFGQEECVTFKLF